MSAAWALLLGSTLGLGLWMIASVAPVMRRPLLMHRVAPYVQGVSEGARDLLSRRSVNPLHVLSSTAGPVWQPLSTLFSRIAGGSELTLQRLRQAKSSLTLSQLRSQQAITAAAGAGVGGAAGIVVAATGGQVLLPLALAPVCAVIAVAGSDWLLQQRAQRRLRRISSELPTVLEFISLSLSAGESLGDSLRRVSARGRGEFAGELAEAMREHATGVPLADALTRLERELAHPPVTRLIEQLRGQSSAVRRLPQCCRPSRRMCATRPSARCWRALVARRSPCSFRWCSACCPQRSRSPCGRASTFCNPDSETDNQQGENHEDHHTTIREPAA